MAVSVPGWRNTFSSWRWRPGNGWVVTGCIDTDQSTWVTDVVGKHIAVPEAFFKAVLLRYREDAGTIDRYEAHAWIMENRSYGFSGFEQKASALEVSIDELEGIIGLDLYPNLVRLIGAPAAEGVESGRSYSGYISNTLP